MTCISLATGENWEEGSLMERAKRMLELTNEESESVSRLIVNPHRANVEQSFYEDFSLRGIRVDRVEPGLVVCTYMVPPRLADRTGYLSSGAIANLVDEVGCSVIFKEGFTNAVSVNMSISYASNAKVYDEVEITARLLGQKGNIFTAAVVLKNKGTGEIVAEGRHTLFSKLMSKI
ncbi:hypothetical protein Nepgr_009219 [Nepenthes gracilis]|uniref:Acyl-coenzyme A thioesterase 13 n=1 Tax=Nepenthes gracilis TaxID=150966 RepID=A0AAD3XK13_NEPGR|nr:hypothetical protein Nepgr_009219 [Nepenthes gracilis]